MINTRHLNILKCEDDRNEVYYELAYYTNYGMKNEMFHVKQFDTLEEAKEYIKK